MNYERGFKRLYTVAAAVWVLYFGALAISNSRLNEGPLLAAIAVGVPIVGYLLFFHVVPWILRGFK